MPHQWLCICTVELAIASSSILLFGSLRLSVGSAYDLHPPRDVSSLLITTAE